MCTNLTVSFRTCSCGGEISHYCGPKVDSLYFFSSRRRHTRYWRDWSSDVCSSDLYAEQRLHGSHENFRRIRVAVVQRKARRRTARNEEGAGIGDAALVGALGFIVVLIKIGRASCRERVYISVVAVSLKKKSHRSDG